MQLSIKPVTPTNYSLKNDAIRRVGSCECIFMMKNRVQQLCRENQPITRSNNIPNDLVDGGDCVLAAQKTCMSLYSGFTGRRRCCARVPYHKHLIIIFSSNDQHGRRTLCHLNHYGLSENALLVVKHARQ